MFTSKKPIAVTLVHMGDSITFGQHLDSKQRWSSLIYDWLDAIYRSTPVHIQSLNRGISGETTRMGLERFPQDVQSAYPDVMTLQFGLNDCNCWLTDKGLPRVSPAAFRSNLVEMIDRARVFGAREIILANNHRTLRHKPMISGERFEDANASYSQILAEVAQEKKTAFCDVRKAFAEFSSEQLEEMLLPYPDHLHLSVKGNAYYAKLIFPIVKEAIEKVLEKTESADHVDQDENGPSLEHTRQGDRKRHRSEHHGRVPARV